MDESTLSQLLFCDILYIIGFFALHKAKDNRFVKKDRTIIGIIVLLLICLFSFVSNDYWHYMEWYNDNHLGEGPSARFWEPVYLYIAEIAPTYFLFRLIIWGGAAILFLLTIKVIKIDIAFVLLIFITRNFLQFSYARVSLAMAMMFLGVALFSHMFRKNIIWVLVGVALVALSVIFHKSAFFGVCIILLSVLLVKLNKYTLTALVILLPLSIYALSQFISVFMVSDISAFGLGMEKIQNSTLDELGIRQNTTITILNVIWRYSLLLVLIMYVKLVFSGRFHTMPISIRINANATVLIIVVAFMFIIVPSITSNMLFYRFLNFSMIPATIFVTYCHTKRLTPLLVNIFYYSGLISTSLILLYKTVVITI